MGCGASKNQESVVAPAQAIEKTSLVAQDLVSHEVSGLNPKLLLHLRERLSIGV